jgi:hypothetical protein
MDEMSDEVPMNEARVRSFADSTTLLLISRIGMAIGVPLISALMIWVLSSINTMEIDIGVMKNQISSGIEDRYHASDAAKDFALRDAAILRNSQDISKLFSGESALASRLDALGAPRRSRQEPYP